MRQYEILAPAGNLPDLQLMLREGADAIYVGLQGYSSRPGSADLDLDQIGQAVDLCHRQNRPLYVAVNANVGQGQMEDLIGKIKEIDRMGADAVILSEFGLISHLSGKLHSASLHASTLMGVYNTETVRLLRDMGVSRVVLYANLFFEEMAEIISGVPELEYELVAEGGTCFNDIRQCRIPHGMRNGEHLLFCRSPFCLTGPEGARQAARPICEPPVRTSEIVGLFMALGVTSFKIEGRTVPGEQRVPMVHALQENIWRFRAQPDLSAYLHYFVRGSRREC